ncbi:phosphatase PAP2 family protein [Allomuricauda sp. SCSIO 65647]|uniref:phosphatase PAP2 family protein n=1 Tax=Allomuricauda sp. SCSIO 65647 TaxID=2908843 RepID=UPI001F3BA3CE|nr:phosphatase PAP2 family protein [Muricauda sp. SCSIO 65647]UJH66843.1 phosphatase PAP2 family protein [Muricauda sp. SCSIO 65647]
MLEHLVQLDQEVFLFLNGLGTETWDGFWMFMTNSKSAIPLYLVLLVLAYRTFRLKKTVLILIAVALLITCTDQLSNFFKYGVQRLRPCHDPEISEIMRLVKSYCGGKFAYFSAHAANSFAVASFFAFLFRRRIKYLGILLMIWAGLVAYSRIYIGVHYPLDVLTGMFVGVLFGWVFSKLSIFAFHKIGV